ncbi:MAG: EI24 domain-containing protein, partial [Planctomycetota bacterium]
MIAFFRGIGDLPRGLGFLLGRGPLVRLAAVPTLITAALYAGLIVLLIVFFGDLMDVLWEKPESGWLLPLYYLLGIVVGAAAVAILFVTFTMVGAAICAPFLTKISHRIRGELEKKPVHAPGGIYADVVYPLWLQIRLLLLLIVVQVGCFVVQIVVPGSTLIVGPFQFFFAGFLLALGFLDYPLEGGELPGFRGRMSYGM